MLAVEACDRLGDGSAGLVPSVVPAARMFWMVADGRNHKNANIMSFPKNHQDMLDHIDLIADRIDQAHFERGIPAAKLASAWGQS